MEVKYEPYNKYKDRKVRPVDISRGVQTVVEGEDLIIISDLRRSQLHNKIRLEKIINCLKENGIIGDSDV